MANAPLCPDHKTEMRAGDPEKGGGWFCPRRTASGGFCKQRVTDAAWRAQQAPAGVPLVGGGNPSVAASAAQTAAAVDSAIAVAALALTGQVVTAHPEWFHNVGEISACAVEIATAMRQSL